MENQRNELRISAAMSQGMFTLIEWSWLGSFRSLRLFFFHR
jgi:hypothetical protein